jgi:class 3 adenylate cyclase
MAVTADSAYVPVPTPAVVTLLFTDIVGSTELLTRVGDEAFDAVRRSHFRLLHDAVVGAGGAEV